MQTQQVKYCKEKDVYYLDLSEDICTQLGWNVGDEIEWKDNNDGSFTLTKINNTTTTGGSTTIINYKAS